MLSNRAQVVANEGVRAERTRILTSLLADLDPLVDSAVAALRAGIPAHAAEDAGFFDDVRDQVAEHYRVNLSALLAERELTFEDLAFVRGGAARRARAGLELADYLNAFRVGLQVLWSAVTQRAGETAIGHEAALELAAPLMRSTDFASTHAGHAYLEFRQYVVADADRERRDLLEHLLAGRMPASASLLASARLHGIAADTQMMVATAVSAAHVGSDVSHAASVIARSGRCETKTLVVAREAHITAVSSLGPSGDPAVLCDRLEAIQRRLCDEGLPLAVGISTLAGGVAELPRAYLEAQAALDCVASEGGVVALTRLSPFDYLIMRSDETTHQLVDPRVREFLDEDRARGGMLTATIRAFADADLNLRVVAERLQVHPHTAQYRLRRVEERTGKSPRHSADLRDLLVAIALDDARRSDLTPSRVAGRSSRAPVRSRFSDTPGRPRGQQPLARIPRWPT
jgi:PucR C-terminal helix-turn-helix domain/GGDEF-like domain